MEEQQHHAYNILTILRLWIIICTISTKKCCPILILVFFIYNMRRGAMVLHTYIYYRSRSQSIWLQQTYKRLYFVIVVF